MAIKRKVLLPLVFALGAAGVMVTAQLTIASHPRPKAATPIKVSLVPAYEQCSSPNRQHGPPLGFPSCSPPVQTSDFLTVGTPDANGAPANSTGFVKIAVIPDLPPVVVGGTITDVRCKAGTSACGNANTVGGPDYTGQLEGTSTIRMTDHFNAVSPGGGNDPATVVDIPFPFSMECANTADPSIGGQCTVPIAAGCPPNCGPRDGDRTLVEITQLQIRDGGADGVNSTSPNTLFMVQGIFIP
jgi:hypothetical protein